MTKRIWLAAASLMCGFSFMGLSGIAKAYDNEVYYSNGAYYWKISNVVGGSSPDLADAIQAGIGTGNRELHILTGGTLTKTIGLQHGLTLRCHNNTFTRSHGGDGLHRDGSGNIAIYDMTLSGGGGTGIHTSRASNLTFVGVKVVGGGIGIRVDSHPSRPYEDGRWFYNLTVQQCTFENCGSHGLETYGVDGFTIDGIIARNCGECGVLINKGINGTIGTVDAYRCSYGGGYAGLRFANYCADCTVQKVIAVECGRGFFTVSTCTNIVVQEVYIRNCSSHAILLQNSDRVGINGGTFNGVGLNHYTSVNCWINALPLGQRKIINRASGRALDMVGNTNGSNVLIYDYWGGANQKWVIAELGNGRYSIRSSQSGGRAVDSSWSPANGVSVYAWEYWNGAPQRWLIQSVGNGHFRITPELNTGQCLDAYGTANSSDVGLWSYWGGNNQQWSIQDP
jgi:hypothetical protein